MTAVLDAILDDLRVGLARRSARRRRARNAAAALATSAAVVWTSVLAAGMVTDAVPETASASTVAAQLIADGRCAELACWPGEPGLRTPTDLVVAHP